MSIEQVLKKNVGKQPAEIVNALLLAGFAIVPIEYPKGADYVRIAETARGNGWWNPVVEFARVKL